MMTDLRVLFATPECAPWVKTGGLGDVSATLPAALHAAGHDLRVLLPAYRAVWSMVRASSTLGHVAAAGELPEATLRGATLPSGVPALLVDSPALFDRPGGAYFDQDGLEWSDSALRFGQLSRVAAALSGPASPLAWRPHVLHCNDWHTGLAPAYLHFAFEPKAATL